MKRNKKLIMTILLVMGVSYIGNARIKNRKFKNIEKTSVELKNIKSNSKELIAKNMQKFWKILEKKLINILKLEIKFSLWTII